VTAEQADIAAKDIAKLPENFRRNQPVPTAISHDLYLLGADSLSISDTFASSHSGNSIQELSFTPDGRFLISGANDRFVAVHDTNSGKEAAFTKDFKQPAHPVLSRDGKYLAVGTGQEIKLYEFAR
jgi:WD40 repeat protein